MYLLVQPQACFLTKWVELEPWFKYCWKGGASADISLYNAFC